MPQRTGLAVLLGRARLATSSAKAHGHLIGQHLVRLVQPLKKVSQGRDLAIGQATRDTPHHPAMVFIGLSATFPVSRKLGDGVRPSLAADGGKAGRRIPFAVGGMTRRAGRHAFLGNPTAVDLLGKLDGLVVAFRLTNLCRHRSVIGREILEILIAFADQLARHEQDLAFILLNHDELIVKIFLILPRQVRITWIHARGTVLAMTGSTDYGLGGACFRIARGRSRSGHSQSEANNDGRGKRQPTNLHGSDSLTLLAPERGARII